MSGQIGWYYLKEGSLRDTHVGPLNEDQVAELIAKRKLKNDSLLLHQTHTGNQWMQLSALDFSAAISRREATQRQQQEQKKAEAQDALRQKQMQVEAARQQRATDEAAWAAEETRKKALQVDARRQYLHAVSDHRKKYKVILADSAEQAEHLCNSVGFEGWDLEQSFTDTFTYSQCCGTESKRQFVLIFSQPLDIEQK